MNDALHLSPTAAPLVTERDMLAAIFGGVAALAYELTGKRLIATLHGPHGDVQIYGDCTVRLIDERQAQEQCPADPA